MNIKRLICQDVFVVRSGEGVILISEHTMFLDHRIRSDVFYTEIISRIRIFIKHHSYLVGKMVSYMFPFSLSPCFLLPTEMYVHFFVLLSLQYLQFTIYQRCNKLSFRQKCQKIKHPQIVYFVYKKVHKNDGKFCFLLN